MNNPQKTLVAAFIILIISLFISFDSNPSNVYLFGFKRLQEKLFEKFQSTPKQKLQFKLDLLETRLRENKAIVTNSKFTFLLDASLRYSSTAGEITELIKSHNLTDHTEQVLKLFTHHQQELQKILDKYPKNLNMEWKYLQDDINYLGTYKDQLSKI